MSFRYIPLPRTPFSKFRAISLVHRLSSSIDGQEGLHSIVSSARGISQEELDNVIGQAKVFYFIRTTGHRITWEKYIEWRKSHPSPFPSAPIDTPSKVTSPSTETQSTAGAPGSPELAPLTFQHIVELIKSGRTDLIPNNNIIPEALHPDPPSASARAVRKKPWETADAEITQISHR